jgi:2-succinyl-6-hydroxy-2,4-cyclohexadiene-1-carboxylate synthase
VLYHVVDGAGPQRVVLVHGFTQTVRSWDGVAFPLADRFEVVRVDLPGHGGSAAQRLDFVETASALARTGGPAVYAGYSMGGRLCLRMALDHPEVVRSLVLVGASPGIADPKAREQRRRSDALLAAELRADDVHGFLDRWLAQPMFETSMPRPADLAARRANPSDGLAYALRTLGTGSQEPLWDRLAELGQRSVPVTLVVGARDAKFRAIAGEMADAIGVAAEVVVIEDAGHAVLLDQPDALADVIAHAATTR